MLIFALGTLLAVLLATGCVSTAWAQQRSVSRLDADGSVHLAVRLASVVVADDEVILALVQPGAASSHLAQQHPATWGTLCVRLRAGGPGVALMEAWRDANAVVYLSADDLGTVRLATAQDDLWLALA